jgi:hypothetical protein
MRVKCLFQKFRPSSWGGFDGPVAKDEGLGSGLAGKENFKKSQGQSSILSHYFVRSKSPRRQFIHIKLFGTRGNTQLKPWNIRKRQLAPMHMHPAELRAAMEQGKHFSGIEQPLLVERGFDRDLLGEIDVVEHFWH